MEQASAFLPKSILHYIDLLTSEFPQAKVYLVGGAVRDKILGRETKDFDLVIKGISAKPLELWLGKHGQVNLVGKNFGVFKWQPESWVGEAIDVALPRTEHIERGTGQYRDFAVQSDETLPIEQDLRRRDFTVNALALDITQGEIIDPTEGLADLKEKKLRAVGNPIERFTEDLSRVLRGIRFACQLDFTFENNTWQALHELAARACLGMANNNWLVPREILARELLKSIKHAPATAIELWDKCGALELILPEVSKMKGCPQPPQFHSEGDVFEHTQLALTCFESPGWSKYFLDAKPSLNLLMSILLHDIGKPLTLQTPEEHGVDRIRTNEHDVVGAKLSEKICERLKLTSYVDVERGQVRQNDLVWLVQHHLLLAHGRPQDFKPATIYRYFLKNRLLGQELLQLLYADTFATHTADKRDLTLGVAQLQSRLAEVETKLDKGKLELLISGHDIMSEFKLPPGPKIGELLKMVEEAQLAGEIKTAEEALRYIKDRL